MQLRLDALEDHPKQATAKGLAPLHVVHNDKHLLALEAIDALRQAARAQSFAEREMMSVEHGFSWSRATEAQQSMSLLGDHKIVELRIPSGKPGEDDGEALHTLAVGTPSGPTTDTVASITLPRLDFVTAKSAWFVALKGAGMSVKVDSVNRTKLPGWIDECLVRQQQRVRPGEPDRYALQFVTGRVKGNLLATHQEIQKLGLLHPPGILMLDDVYDAVLSVARYDILKLSGAMLTGDVPRLVRILERLQDEDEATVLALWTLTEEIRVLLEIVSGTTQDKPVASILWELRVWGPRERLVPQAARRSSQCEPEGALLMAAKFDRQVRGPCELSLPTEP